jgi:beta-glucanase (GH16 family)
MKIFFVMALCFVLLPVCAEEPAQGLIYSGRVNTEGKFSFQYGRIEASIKLPKTAAGLWPAFWLLGADFGALGWPACGEIDIMEMGKAEGIRGGSPESYLTSAFHWGSFLPGGGYPVYSKDNARIKNLQDGFHLYTMIWDESKIGMYLDGETVPYFEMKIDVYSGDFAVGNYFHKPFFIILNLAAGGDYPRVYDATGITALNKTNNYSASMYVDYVRVYDKAGGLVWHDEFEGPAPDSGKWNIEENDFGGGNNELQVYRRQNVSVGPEPETGRSCLILTAEKK